MIVGLIMGLAVFAAFGAALIGVGRSRKATDEAMWTGVALGILVAAGLIALLAVVAARLGY